MTSAASLSTVARACFDGAVSPHEGLTQTQETQVFEDTQVMEETEEGEIDMNLEVNLEGRDTRVVESG